MKIPANSRSKLNTGIYLQTCSYGPPIRKSFPVLADAYYPSLCATFLQVVFQSLLSLLLSFLRPLRRRDRVRCRVRKLSVGEFFIGIFFHSLYAMKAQSLVMYQYLSHEDDEMVPVLGIGVFLVWVLDLVPQSKE